MAGRMRRFGILLLLTLTAAITCRGDVFISEFMAGNTRVLADEDGDYEDWIELYNGGTNTVDLNGWYLTDSAANPAKWRFPATNIASHAFMIVFASAKDRDTPGKQLHTNFKLSKGNGKYIGLVPAGTTNAASSITYPAQADNVSYGYALMGQGWAAVLGNGSDARWHVPASNIDYTTYMAGWTNTSFNDASWSAGQLGIGYDRLDTFGSLIGAGGDCDAAAYGKNCSLCVRVPFMIANTSQVVAIRLKSKHNDGFVAWLNGVPLASDLAPASLAWNSAATAMRSDDLLDDWTLYSVTNAGAMLRNGTNVLAIQALNNSTTSSNLLALTSLEVLFAGGTAATNSSYMATPTPGEANSQGRSRLGPLISDVTSTLPQPTGTTASPPATIYATVDPTLSGVAGVNLAYRTMFSNEVVVAMTTTAVAGVYAATIATTNVGPAQMLRWRVTAWDSAGVTNTDPAFLDPINSDQYYGIVARETTYTSALPVWYWFTTNYSASLLRGGTRGCVYYNGHFCDNCFIRARGGATSGGSQKFDFNAGNHMPIDDLMGTVEEANLNTPGADTATYIRPVLAFETYRLAGSEASDAFHVQMRCNAASANARVAYIVEQIDERLLRRCGLDDQGALYKMDQRSALTPVFYDATDGVQKKTRLYEGNEDLQAFVTGLNQSDRTARLSWFFDNVHVPQLMNYLAIRAITQDADDVRKNFYMYRDTLGDGEWRILPWDKDYTFGIVGDGLPYLPHPFFGDYLYRKVNSSDQWNKLLEFIFNEPVTRAMYTRRLRTTMDEFLEPPGTTQSAGRMENRARAWMRLISSNVSATVTGNITVVYSYITQRRTDLYVTYSVTNATVANQIIPLAQPPDAAVSIDAVEYNPASGNQLEEYIRVSNTNAFDVDVSGWSVTGGVRHVFAPGTVILASNVLYLTPDVNAFRARVPSPHGGQGLFIQGGYSGQLSARGESLGLLDATGRSVTVFSYAGTPSDAQQYLRIVELMYNPADPPAGSTNTAQDYEYIELRNISTNTALNLAGIRLSQGVVFDFTNSPLQILAPGQAMTLVRNAAAFAERYGTNMAIAGVYSGALDNGGETIRLDDADGEKILEFAYDNDWYPVTDGHGFSLVIRDDTAMWETWSSKASWRPSGLLGGSPGTADPGDPHIPELLINEALTHTDPPQSDYIEIWNPTTNAVDIGGWYLSDDRDEPEKYRIPDGTLLPAGGYVAFDESDFNPPPFLFPSFVLSPVDDDVWLFSGDAASTLTGYATGWAFGAQQNGVSFGRYVNSQGDAFFVAQSTNTEGAVNAPPRIWPVVVSEIMYAPAATSNATSDQLEYIEIQNVTATNVPLFDPAATTNTFRLRNAVDFDFPTNVTLPGGGSLLVVSFNPLVDTNSAAAFRSAYGLSTNVMLLGPWSGHLDDDGETVELRRPDPPDPTLIPYILVESIHYRAASPWPTGAVGTACSIQRHEIRTFGDDPTNWYVWGRSPGTTNVMNQPPVVTINSPADGSATAFPSSISVQLAVSNTDPGDAALSRLLIENVPVSGWTNAANWTLFWTPPAPGNYILSAEAVDSFGLHATSTAARVYVIAYLTNRAVLVATNANWRYLDNGSNQGTNWVAVSFDDSTWASGPAQLGYGDGDEATVVGYGTNSNNRYPTTYFRSGFMNASPGTSTGLLMRVLRDDGVIVYLNGREVFRNNMAAGTATYTTYASATVSGTEETSLYVTNWMALSDLAAGTNVLAAEIHQVNATSSDISFALELVAEGPPPYESPRILTDPSDTAVDPLQTVVFAVSATGTPPPLVIWCFGGTAIPGATQSILVVSNAWPQQAGAYWAMASNVAGVVSSRVAVLTIRGPDFDADGMPDAWELERFGELAETYDGDWDRDGVANGLEWRAGSDPTNALSYLAMQSMSPVQNGTVMLTWRSETGRTYLVERSTNLMSGCFQPVGSNLSSGGFLSSWTWTNDLPIATFYRIRLQQQ